MRIEDLNLPDPSLAIVTYSGPVADRFGIPRPFITDALYGAKSWFEARERLGTHDKPGLIETLKEVIDLEG